MIYIVYIKTCNTIANAVRSKKVCNAGIPHTCSPWSDLKLTRESQ